MPPTKIKPVVPVDSAAKAAEALALAGPFTGTTTITSIDELLDLVETLGSDLTRAKRLAHPDPDDFSENGLDAVSRAWAATEQLARVQQWSDVPAEPTADAHYTDSRTGFPAQAVFRYVSARKALGDLVNYVRRKKLEVDATLRPVSLKAAGGEGGKDVDEEAGGDGPDGGTVIATMEGPSGAFKLAIEGHSVLLLTCPDCEPCRLRLNRAAGYFRVLSHLVEHSRSTTSDLMRHAGIDNKESLQTHVSHLRKALKSATGATQRERSMFDALSKRIKCDRPDAYYLDFATPL